MAFDIVAIPSIFNYRTSGVLLVLDRARTNPPARTIRKALYDRKLVEQDRNLGKLQADSLDASGRSLDGASVAIVGSRWWARKSWPGPITGAALD